MEKILKYFLILSLLIQVSCNPAKKTIITKHHFVSDTLFRTKTELIQLPANYTYFSNTPCKNDSLIIADQMLAIGKLKLEIKNLKGKLLISIKTDTIKDTKERETLKHAEKQDEKGNKTVYVKYIPKWVWLVLSYSVIATIWIFRKPILKLITFI